MLIDFRVKNFRSLRDEQVLSLVAAKDTTLQDLNTFSSGVRAAPRLLRSAVLYGPNAGGKSNLIKALQYMRAAVIESAGMPPDQDFTIKPFLLDADFSSQATEFEITLLIDGVRHQYGFALTRQRITKEYLLVYKSSKPQQWFNRQFDQKSGKYHYEFSSFLKGKKNFWEDATRSNSLFLSMAVQLNSEQLRPIFDWFSTGLTIINEAQQLNPQFSIDMLRNVDGKQSIKEFLVSADLSISDIDVITQKRLAHTFEFKADGEAPSVTKVDQDFYELRFSHSTEKGSAVFELEEESTGTRNLLFLTGPILDILKKGRTLVVDELDTSLHPLLVKRLVELFHNSKLNPNGAQLIFTTHDTSLLNSDLFRRDQIWFVEKDQAQASALYPLSDFSPRKNEALEQGYLMGRYGALPFFSEWSGVR